jgi:tripartite-type tricarboxylate transporter receptor subunit TctC
MPFDPEKDFAAVALIGTVPLVLVAAPDRGLDSLATVVSAAKSRSLSFASAGNGTVGHLVGEIWQRAAGVKLLHVPYKGAAQAMTDLAGGQVDIFFASLPAALPLIRSGKLRALAVTSSQRAPLLAEVPTVAESGLNDFEATVWYGVVAPAATPAPIVARLNAEINRVLQTPEVRSRYAADGIDVRGGTAAEFAAFTDRERAKWSRAVRESGARID